MQASEYRGREGRELQTQLILANQVSILGSMVASDSGTKPRRRIRVLCVNHRDPAHPRAGGAERYLWETLSRLDPERFDVTWRSESVRGRPRIEQLGNVRIIRRGGRLTLHLLAPFAAGGYDLVIESVAHAVPFHTGVSHRGPRVVILYHVHQSILRRELPPIVAGIVRVLERSVRFEKATFVTISNATREEAQRLLGVREPIEVVPPGVDHQFFVPGTALASPPDFLCLGRLKRYKRVDSVIAAFSALQEPGTLTIVGDGEDRARLEEAAQRVKGVRFTGSVSEEEKRRRLQAATAIVIASEAEGFGLAILEAGSTATPTVAVDLPVYRDVIANRVSGILVPRNDATALSEALRYVRDHPELRDGAAHMAGRFAWETTATQFAALLDKAVRSLP